MNDVARSCFESIPRERWADHPHYPSQVLLLGSHQRFRQVSRSLSASEPSPLPIRHRLFEEWQRAMRSHEHYEEHKLYPFLRRRFGVRTAALEAGHQALHGIEATLNSAAELTDEASWRLAMRRYDVLLHEHLRDEEDLVIPCLLALSPREFASYYHGSASTLLAETPSCSC